ncbi:MAG: DUF3187 family protein [Candidatus Lambdaproteobacteria bacterium]|nr:DUF3187 family protein [Candidatus Lambdaproteobacteria bacterium]
MIHQTRPAQPLRAGLLCAAAIAIAAATAGAQTAPVEASSPAAPASGGDAFFFTTQSPVQRLRLGFLHEAPVFGAAGTLRVASGAIWANTWNSTGRYLIDGESWWLNQFVEYALTDRAAVSLMVPIVYESGGVMDDTIEAFHRALRLGSAGRDKAPRNRLRAEQYAGDGTMVVLLDDSDQGFSMRAPVVSGRWRLTGSAADWPAALKVSLNFPRYETRTVGLRRDQHDYGAALSMAHRFSPRLTGSASLAYLRGRRATVDFDLRNWLGSFSFSADYQAWSATALSAQLRRETPVGNRTRTPFDVATTELLLGAKHRLGAATSVEFGFVENLFIFDNTADFALFGAIRTAFR